MSSLFYTGQSRRTNGAFSVTMKDGAKLAKKTGETKGRRRDSNQENRVGLHLQSSSMGKQRDPATLWCRYRSNQRGGPKNKTGGHLHKCIGDQR